MATIGQKAEYVKAQPQTRKHHCHWSGCQAQVPPAMWGCKKHWFTLPTRLRNSIWAAYRPGQEKDGTPSREYLAVAREVQEWIARYEQEKIDLAGNKAGGRPPSVT